MQISIANYFRYEMWTLTIIEKSKAKRKTLENEYNNEYDFRKEKTVPIDYCVINVRNDGFQFRLPTCFPFLHFMNILFWFDFVHVYDRIAKLRWGKIMWFLKKYWSMIMKFCDSWTFFFHLIFFWFMNCVRQSMKERRMS